MTTLKMRHFLLSIFDGYNLIRHFVRIPTFFFFKKKNNLNFAFFFLLYFENIDMFINHSYILNLTIKEKIWDTVAAENFYAADLLPQHHIFERTIKEDIIKK